MGALILKYPDLAARVAAWAGHPNRWVKRAAAVSFLKLAKRPEHLDMIYRVARRLCGVDDDLIEKATGWLLREAGKTDAGRLERFLLASGPAVPRTTLRYAIERFPAAKRQALLVRTRGGRGTCRRTGRRGERPR
jgi:3-methyladenine DNA glycosylase AlkD